MIRILRRRRERVLLRLGEGDRELAAAWFVVLLAAAAGLSFLGVQRYAAGDCLTTLAMPRVIHRPLAIREDREDPACPAVLCGHATAGHDRDDESDQAAG